MKKLIGLLKRHAMLLALIGVLLIFGIGVYLLQNTKKSISKMETEIKNRYGELKKYEIDKSKAPSPDLINNLTDTRDELTRNFRIMMTKFSTSYPAPPQYVLYPTIEFKEFLYFSQDYLAKKARKNKVSIPTSFGFPETGLPPADQIPILSLKLEIVKKLVDLTIDSGVTVLNNVTPGDEKSIAFYKALPLQVTITGTSTEIVRFLKYLENPSSFFVLDSFSLSRTETGLFRAEMTVSAIMLQMPEESKPVATQAGPPAGAGAPAQPPAGPGATPPPVPGAKR